MFSFKSSEDVLSLSEFPATLPEGVAPCRTSPRPPLLPQHGRAPETVSLEDFEKDVKSRRAKEDRRRKSKTARLRVAV